MIFVCRSLGSNPVPPDLSADTLPTALPRMVAHIMYYKISTFVHYHKLKQPDFKHLHTGETRIDRKMYITIYSVIWFTVSQHEAPK